MINTVIHYTLDTELGELSTVGLLVLVGNIVQFATVDIVHYNEGIVVVRILGVDARYDNVIGV